MTLWIVKPDLLIQTETILGALLYLIGVGGSYLRYGKHERRGKVDAIYMICITWGFCAIMVALMSIAKYAFVPTLHMAVVRVLYYSGAFFSSLVFFAKDFLTASKQCKISANLLVGSMAFLVGEGLGFYLGLSYQAAIFASVGIMLMYFATFLRERRSTTLFGLAMLALPIFPKLIEGKFDLNKMKVKREIAIQRLLEDQRANKNDNQEIADMPASDSSHR